ncbi:MAG: hypothetical protein GY782_06515 [Gammaproteobacteria bacterium]|nr:hypothetical protein [Gammaproteobacteria bacterium]
MKRISIKISTKCQKALHKAMKKDGKRFFRSYVRDLIYDNSYLKPDMDIKRSEVDMTEGFHVFEIDYSEELEKLMDERQESLNRCRNDLIHMMLVDYVKKRGFF